VRRAVVPWWELPGEASCLAAAACDPLRAAYHSDGEPLVRVPPTVSPIASLTVSLAPMSVARLRHTAMKKLRIVILN
jgi:hypothetical protein